MNQVFENVQSDNKYLMKTKKNKNFQSGKDKLYYATG